MDDRSGFWRTVLTADAQFNAKLDQTKGMIQARARVSPRSNPAERYPTRDKRKENTIRKAAAALTNTTGQKLSVVWVVGGQHGEPDQWVKQIREVFPVNQHVIDAIVLK